MNKIRKVGNILGKTVVIGELSKEVFKKHQYIYISDAVARNIGKITELFALSSSKSSSSTDTSDLETIVDRINGTSNPKID